MRTRARAVSSSSITQILTKREAEVAALVLYHRWTGRGVAPSSVLLNLASGAFLLLAMRAGLAGAWWGWVSLCLAAAGLLHAADLRRLWR